MPKNLRADDKFWKGIVLLSQYSIKYKNLYDCTRLSLFDIVIIEINKEVNII